MSTIRKLRRSIRLVIDRIPVLNRHILTSSGHQALTADAAKVFADATASHSWDKASRRQARIYDRLLQQMHSGAPRADFKQVAEAVRRTGLETPTLLEVGCGNGYYSEVLARLTQGVRYTGLDRSPAMVASARARYPTANFIEGDATRLPLADGAYDIVMDGVSLMHIINYRAAIAEMSRVASRFVILNSLPLFEVGPTAFLRKYAYGAPVIEIIFGREEIELAFKENGFVAREIFPSLDYDIFHVTGRHSAFATLLFARA